MARKKDAGSSVVEFFETATLETAQTVLAICKGVVARRQPVSQRKARAPRPVVDVVMGPRDRDARED